VLSFTQSVYRGGFIIPCSLYWLYELILKSDVAHRVCCCIFADVARSKDVRNIYLLHECLLRLLQKDLSLKFSLHMRVYMHQLYCLEDVFLTA